jgi:hypothetical protein
VKERLWLLGEVIEKGGGEGIIKVYVSVREVLLNVSRELIKEEVFLRLEKVEGVEGLLEEGGVRDIIMCVVFCLCINRKGWEWR